MTIPKDEKDKYDAVPAVVGLHDVALDDSYVVALLRLPEGLVVVMRAQLLPSHPAYEPPPPTDRGDFRWARLVFERPEEIDLNHRLGAAGPSVDEDDYGEISALRHAGPWIELHDLDGVIRVRGGVARFELLRRDWEPGAIVEATPFDLRPAFDATLDVPSLAYVWLDESSVVAVDREGDDLRLLLHAVLLPGHPDYRFPPPTDFACYRWAYLVFDHPEETELRHALGPAGPSVEDDYGEIYALQHDGEWIELRDDGVIRVRGGDIRFELQPREWVPPLTRG